MEVIVFIVYAAIITFIFLLGNFLFFSGKAILRVFFNCIVGWFCLSAVNLLFSSMSFHIAINAITIFIAGILGLPGIILLGSMFL